MHRSSYWPLVRSRGFPLPSTQQPLLSPFGEIFAHTSVREHQHSESSSHRHSPLSPRALVQGDFVHPLGIAPARKRGPEDFEQSIALRQDGCDLRKAPSRASHWLSGGHGWNCSRGGRDRPVRLGEGIRGELTLFLNCSAFEIEGEGGGHAGTVVGRSMRPRGWWRLYS